MSMSKSPDMTIYFFLWSEKQAPILFDGAEAHTWISIFYQVCTWNMHTLVGLGLSKGKF